MLCIVFLAATPIGQAHLHVRQGFDELRYRPISPKNILELIHKDTLIDLFSYPFVDQQISA